MKKIITISFILLSSSLISQVIVERNCSILYDTIYEGLMEKKFCVIDSGEFKLHYEVLPATINEKYPVFIPSGKFFKYDSTKTPIEIGEYYNELVFDQTDYLSLRYNTPNLYIDQLPEDSLNNIVDSINNSNFLTPIGTWKYFENGTVQLEGRYSLTISVDTMVLGPCKGNDVSIIRFTSYERDGTWIEYDKNGEVIWKGKFERDHLKGNWKKKN